LAILHYAAIHCPRYGAVSRHTTTHSATLSLHRLASQFPVYVRAYDPDTEKNRTR